MERQIEKPRVRVTMPGRVRCRRWMVVAGLFLLALPADRAGAGEDAAAARYVPWSGSYWPIREGALAAGPLRKYDLITGRRAAQWELEQNPPLPTVPEWFGYCHAWAAAAVMDREPIRLRNAAAPGGMAVPLDIGDQKGLLTACHTDDVAQHYGVRFQGEPGDDPQDIYPDELWRVLRLYIKERGVPLILDIEGGTQVWNYPVYAYRVTYEPAGADNRYQAELSLWMADDAVPQDMVGVQVSKQTYYFSVQVRGGSVVVGSGRWVEPSVNDHPDFAWYPYIVRTENPEIEYARVKQLVDASGPGPTGTSEPGATDPSAAVRPPDALPVAPGVIPSHPGAAYVPPNVLPGVPARLPADPAAAAAAADRVPVGPEPCLLSPVEFLRLITNRTSQFSLDVTVDKFDGGQYASGERFTVRGSSAKAAYLYLLFLDQHGQLSVLFPRPGEANQISAQRGFELPRAGAPYAFHTATGPGVQRIKAVATLRPLGLSGLTAPPAGGQPPGAAAYHFRLPPRQKALFQEVLGRYVGEKSLDGAAPDRMGPHPLVGEFGQDEVAIYVGPPEPAEVSRGR